MPSTSGACGISCVDWSAVAAVVRRAAFGLCRLAINGAVRASDVPVGVPTPRVDELAVLLPRLAGVRGPGLSVEPDVMGAAEASASVRLATRP
jgi:hypothetical protein